MAYADGLLSKGERVIHREKQHWFVFIWGARYTILAIIAAILVAILTSGMTGTGTESTIKQIFDIAVIVLFVAGIANLGWTVLRYLNQEYVITNRRVVQVQGVLNKSSTDSSLEKINDARLSQSIFGRMFGFGDLEILTAAETGIDEFRMLINPVAFKIAMLDAKHEYELEVSGGDDHVAPPLRNPTPASAGAPVAAAAGAAPVGPTDETLTSRVSGAPPPAAMSPDDVTRTLVSLADLRDRGAITADEYERKKAELLGRL